jgi:hypothetical protein
MERLNDAFRRLIDWGIASLSVVLHVVVLIRLRAFGLQQAWLRRRYRIGSSTTVRGYDTETIRNIERSAGTETTYVHTSGSTRQPKGIAYDARRLRTTLLVFLSAMCRILKTELPQNRTFFVMAPIRSDGSLTALMLKKRILPDYLCRLTAPHCVQGDRAIQEAASTYGDAAVWLWLLAIANPGLIYATNPSTIASFMNTLSTNWTLVSRLTRDYVQGHAEHQTEFRRIYAGIAARGAKERLDRIAASADTLSVRILFPGLRAFSCWDGGYTRLFVEQIRKHLPEDQYRHVPMYSMSTETVETVPVPVAGRYAYLPLAPGVLYEFIECGDEDLVSNLRRPLDFQIGHTYTMVVSDAYGLRRYQTEDVFECVGFVKSLPDLRFVHRRNLSYSFTGEKLTAEQLRLAYAEAAEKFEAVESQCFLTCFPSFPEGASIPRYRLVIVGLSSKQFNASNEIADFVQARLVEINSEYAAKIRSGRLAGMSAQVVGVSEFVTNMVKGGGGLSQFKFLPLYPRLWETLSPPGRGGVARSAGVVHDSTCQLGR